ncbi:GDSL-like lipase/acylhydrolase family protein [Fontibacillus phaseoli]|uniref:GDSL-like lipase/acylhydrolase family protein n=1 Tax=Fontibacillus phaseoli TaxID=1416533 RepID=A0A369BAU8_9BACL|nr:SGNH/GDSL hydrolase family protein [Fontibacillus phaseoli]RCX17718.1 GDSL-like lipase/acylhydrolase family protein [Fontibacillus phaseoli]
MQKNKNLKQQALSDIEHIQVHGRTTGNLSPLTLFWTGSAVEFNAKGAELWLELEVDYEVYEPWIGIVINGAVVSRQMLVAGRYWVCIFRGMNADAVKNVRIVKEVQAMSGDPGCSLQIHAVRFDGQFLPVEDKPYKLEFIGDSITSGEGTVGAKTEEDWIPMWFSALSNYAAMTAESLNADYRVISQSGWGVLTAWDNNPHCNLPDHYGQVCGLLSGPKNEALGAFRANDFDAWQPDVVIINLGTNDGSAFHSPEWSDQATGETRKQRLNEDGTYHAEDLKSFEEAVRSFLAKLRKNNKKAHLVWAYGMLGIPLMPAIYRAVDAYVNETGDKRVSVFQLPDMTEEAIGSRSHPGAAAHEKASKELTGYIREILRQG